MVIITNAALTISFNYQISHFQNSEYEKYTQPVATYVHTAVNPPVSLLFTLTVNNL